MKSIRFTLQLSILILCALAPLPGRAAQVLIPLETCGISPAAGRNVILTPLQALGSGSIPVMDKIQGTTDENGNWEPALMPGVYQADVRPAWGSVGTTEFYFYVDPTDAVQNAFANLLANTNNTWPPNQYAYSAQASDARYAPASAVNTNVFNVKSFGATGDGRICGDISETNGVLLTSPLGRWTPADIGDMCAVGGAGNNLTWFFTGISNVINPTTIILSNAPVLAVTNGWYLVYGPHNDGPAWQIAHSNACLQGGNVYFPRGIYLIASPWQQTNENNAQILSPYVNNYGGNAPAVTTYGDQPFTLWGGTTTWLDSSQASNATIIVEMQPGTGYTGSNYISCSMFDTRPSCWTEGAGKMPSTGNNISWPANNILFNFHDLTFLCSYDPNLCVLNLFGSAQFTSFDNIYILGGGVDGHFTPEPNGTNGYGIIFPGPYEGSFNTANYNIVEGFYNDIDGGLLDSTRLTLGNAENAISMNFGSTPYFYIHNLQISDCKNILTPGPSASGANVHINLIWKQDTSVPNNGGYSWFIPNGGVRYLFDPHHYFNTAVSELLGPDSYEGTNICFIGGSNCVESMDWFTSNPNNPGIYPTNGANGQVGVKIYNSPVWFDAPAVDGAGLFANNPIFQGVLNLNQVTGVINGAILIPPIITNNPEFQNNGIVFSMNTSIGSGDTAYIMAGTRGSQYWEIGANDVSGFDPFPAADWAFYPKPPGGGIFGPPALLLTTNSSAFVGNYFEVTNGLVLPPVSSYRGPFCTNGLSVFWNSNGVAFHRSSALNSINWSENIVP